MAKNKVSTTTEIPVFDWNEIYCPTNAILESRSSLIGEILIPGSLPSVCIFALDCFLTVLHFVISSYIPNDFTTTFLGTVYLPTTILKLVYIIKCFLTAEWINEVNFSLNQLFNVAMILSCIAYNFMCLFVANNRKIVPLTVSRAVFGLILLICSFLVIAPKAVTNRCIDNCLQFAAQLFGILLLIAQILWSLRAFICKKIDIKTEEKELKLSDSAAAANDVIQNANGRRVWANCFSLIIVIVSIPQIAPLTTSWMPYHVLVQSITQLNALFLSVAVFMVLPTYRSAVFGSYSNCNGSVNLEKVSVDKEEARKNEPEKKAPPPLHQNFFIPNLQIPRVRLPVIPSAVSHANGEIRIIVEPIQSKY